MFSYHPPLCSLLYLSQIKAALGLDRTRGFFSGAAPLSVDTLNYFASVGIPIYEGKAGK